MQKVCKQTIADELHYKTYDGSADMNTSTLHGIDITINISQITTALSAEQMVI